jgi:uncharacterized protein (TIGR02996 family)
MRWEKEARDHVAVLEIEKRSDGTHWSRTGQLIGRTATVGKWVEVRDPTALVASNEASGFVLVEDLTVGNARHAELEAAILAAPEDDNLRRVYADWLLSNGDARGWMVAAELTGDLAMIARVDQLVHQRVGLGEAGGRRRLVHRQGLAYQAHVEPSQLPGLEVEPLLATLDYLRVVVDRDVLAGKMVPRLPIRTMVVEAVHGRVFRLEEAWAQLPRLTSLSLRADSIDCANFPTLEALEIHTPSVSDSLFVAATAPSESLRSLRMSVGGVLRLSSILGDANRWPNLTRLGLSDGALPADFFSALPRSPLLPRLRRLELAGCALTDASLDVLLAERKAFAHLYVDLSRNHLTRRGRERAAELAATVYTETQFRS